MTIFDKLEDECIDIDETRVIHGLRTSDRLFFDPTGNTSSILVKSSSSAVDRVENNLVVPFKGTVAEEMESENPYLDFKVSMEKMVIAHGLKDLDFLEELVQWYLKTNEKETHGFILGAFMDLLVDIVSVFPSPSPTPTICSSSSSLSFCTRSSSPSFTKL